MPGEVEAKLTVIVVVDKETEEEAWRLPEIWRVEVIVEEAEEINPPYWDANPPTLKVEEAWSTPATWRLPATVEEAAEIKAPSSFANPPTLKVEEACNTPA